MDFFLLVFNIFFVCYSFYAWGKYADREYLLLASLGSFVVILLGLRMFFLDLFPDSIRPILDVLRYGAWVFVLGALVFIEAKKRKK